MPEQAMSWVDERWAQWTRYLLEKGERRARAEQAAMLLRQAELKFGAEAVEGLAGVGTSGEGPAGLSLARLSEWIIDCATLKELLERVENGAE